MDWGEIFIGAEQAADLLAEGASLQLFDCRFALSDTELGRRRWADRHLGDAAYLHLDEDLSAPVTAKSGRHPLASTEQVGRLARRYGLRPNSLIVCYDGGGEAFAARAWFSLRQHGYYGCRILDGGLAGWERKGHASPRTCPPKPSEWPVRCLRLDQFLDNPDYVPVDARANARFRGESEALDPYPGCIPGAINRFWQEVFDEEGYVIPDRDWHLQRWQEIPPGKSPVNYCGSGVTALPNVLSLLLAGKSPVFFYPGGWSEYCARHPR